MSVLEDLDDGECALWAILQDQSGLDQAEFFWYSADHEDGCFRAWPFQWAWWRTTAPLQIDQCVAEGQLVLTEYGHVPIEEVAVGTRVLTHQGRWRPVTYVWDRGEQDVVKVVGEGHPGLIVTPDHPILARKARRASKPRDGHKGKKLLEAEWLKPSHWEWNDGSGQMNANWGSPARIEATDLPPAMEPAYASGRQNLVVDQWSEAWMWLYGLYVAEGSCYIDAPEKGLTHRVRWSVHPDEVDAVTLQLDKVGLKWSASVAGTAVNISVTSKPVTLWLREAAGVLAHNKRLAPWVFGLPEHLRRAVFEGLMFGDAHYRNGRWSYTTVSRSLAVEVRLLGLSLGESSSVIMPKLRVNQTIQGRAVNTRQPYVVDFLPLHGQRKPHTQIIDGVAWSPVKKVIPAGRARVYDLEVEEDHSFVVESLSVHNCARSVGKSLSIKVRMFAFPFLYPGQEAVITAPELVHLEPIVSLVETQFYNCRIGREIMPRGRGAVTHRPFQMNFNNGSRIIGRIPQRDGKGVKGIHPIWLELDEAQDYPEAGWVELYETLKRGFEGAVWRAHGVTRGLRDKFYEFTQDSPDNDWKVHRYSAMYRPNWSDQERQEKIKQYGSREHPDYRRNILGLHGDATNPMFVLHRLMRCVDSDETSDYNLDEYQRFDVKDETMRFMGQDILQVLDFPSRHKTQYKNGIFWVGMDVGYMNHPSEILVFVEYRDTPKQVQSKLKLLTRVHLERIAHGDQVKAILWTIDYYKPRAFAMDKTGLGLPLFQDIQERTAANPAMRPTLDTIKGYNFSEKILVDFDQSIELHEFYGDPVKDAAILRNVLEYSSDRLRDLVDNQRIILPWDRDLIAEFQGQTWTSIKGTQDQYGRRIYSKGKFHSLDAARMAALGHAQYAIEEMTKKAVNHGPVLDMFVPMS